MGKGYDDWLKQNGGGAAATPSSSNSSGQGYKDWLAKNGGQTAEPEQPKQRDYILNTFADAILSPFGVKTQNPIMLPQTQRDPDYVAPSTQYRQMTTTEQKRAQRLGITPEETIAPAPVATPAELNPVIEQQKEEQKRSFWDFLGNALVAGQTGQAPAAQDQNLQAAQQAQSALTENRAVSEDLRETNKQMKELADQYRLTKEQRDIYNTRKADVEKQLLAGMDRINSMSETELIGFNELMNEYKQINDALANDSATVGGSLARKSAAGLVGVGGSAVENAGQVSAPISMSQYNNIPEYMLTPEQRAAIGRNDVAAVGQGTQDILYGLSDRLAARQAELTEFANRNQTSVVRGAGDIVQNVTEMAMDGLVNTLTGGGGLAFMGTRVFGQSAGEARRAGATDTQQILYGLAKAGVEVLSEKMFDVFGIYGGGAADDVTEALVGKLTKNKAVAKLLTIAFGGLGESAEELASGIADPLAGAILGNEAKYDKEWLEDTGYSMLIAGIIGSFGGGVKVVGNTIQTAQGKALEIGSQEWRDAILPEEAKAKLEAAGIDVEEAYTALEEACEEATKEAPSLSPAQQAILSTIQDGVSNSKAQTILNDPEMRSAFEALTDTITGTKSEQRAFIKENAQKVVDILTGNAPEVNTQTETTAEPVTQENTAPTETEAETATETPTDPVVNETTETEQESAPEANTETTERQLKPTQQKVADLLAKGNDITDADIDYILDNKSRVNALHEFGLDDLGETTQERRAAVRALAEDIAHNGVPSAEAVAKIKQDREVESQESAARYTEDQLNEQIKAARLEGQWEKVKALAKQRNKLIRQRLTKHIFKTTDKLTKDLTKATESKFVPSEFVESTTQFLEAINELRMDPDAETKTGKKAYEKFLKISDQFSRLRDAVSYEDGVEQKGVGFSEDVQAMMDNAREVLRDVPWGEMGEAELTSIDNALKAMNASIRNARTVMLRGRAETAFRIGSEMENEIKEDAKGGDTVIQNYSQLMERPLSFFEKMAGYKKNSMWKAMYDMLNNGQKKAIDLRLKAADQFKSLLQDYQNYKTLRSTVEIEGLKDTDGNNIKISRGMMLSLYMHLLNEQNANHIAGGGLTIANVQDYYSSHHDKGFGTGRSRSLGMSADLSKLNYQLRQAKEQARTAEANGATEEQMTEYNEEISNLQSQVEDRVEQERLRIEKMAQVIEEKMTPYDREFVQTAQDFFKWAQDNINSTTQDVYGFAKALVENYFPIASDSNFRSISMDEMRGTTKSLENAGILQQRTNSDSPMYLLDISDVLNGYMKDMSQICGIMPAVKNFNKVYNTSKAGFDSSLRDTMRKTFGERADNYITNLMADLQGGRKSKPGILDKLLSTTRGNFAASVLTMNLRVAGSQAASWFNAASVVGRDNLVKSLGAKLADLSLIREYSPLLAARTSDKTTPSFMDNRTNLASQRDRITRKLGFLLNWINNVDNFTVRSLWNAAENYVQSQNADLAQGSDAYYKEVGKVFDEIVERTQPGYEVMQRPDILREPSTLARTLTMFMTQRLQNYNEVHDQLRRAAKFSEDFKAGRNGVTQADVTEARKNAATAVSSVVASSLALTVMKAGVDAILHRTKNYRDKETGELTLESALTRILDYTGESLASNILGGSELYSIARHFVTGDKLYLSSVPGVDTIADMVEDIAGAFTASEKNRPAKIRKAAESVATAFGVPLSNANLFVDAAINWADDYKEGTFLESDYDYTTAQNKARLYNALEANDDDKVVSVLASMGENAKDNARDAIKTHYDAGDINDAETVRMLTDIGYSNSKSQEVIEDWTTSAEKKATIDAFKKDHPKTGLSDGNIIRYTNSTDKPQLDIYEKATADMESKYEKSIGSMTKTEIADYISGTSWLNEIEKRQMWNTLEADGKLDAVKDSKMDVASFLALYAEGNKLEQATANRTKTGEDNRNYSAVDAIVDVYRKEVKTDTQADLIKEEYSWFDELAEADKAGMDSRTWFTYYDKYRDIDKLDMTATEKHDEFAKFVDRSSLTEDQKSLIKSQLVYRTMMTVKDTMYDRMSGNGMDVDLADKYSSEIARLEPLSGKSQVSASQKAEVIWSDTSVSIENRMNNLVMSGIQPSQTDFAKWLSANVSHDDALRYWKMIGEMDDPPWKTGYDAALKKAK